MKLLNVGGYSKDIPIPKFYGGWEHHILDIDTTVKPDILCDARDMNVIPDGSYDAVYCSHNLEHFYGHDVGKVLSEFIRVLTPDGFAHIIVPNVKGVLDFAAKNNIGLHDKVYESPAGPISVHDILYGHGEFVAKGGEAWAHKVGFDNATLIGELQRAGFKLIYYTEESEPFAITAIAYKQEQDKEEYKELLKRQNNG